MRLVVAAVLAVVLAGCGGSGSPGASSPPDGCLFVGDAASAFQDFRDGIANRTATDTDSAASLKKVASKLDEAALILPERNQGDAKIAATDAGRLRVALIDGDNSTVSADATDLNDKLDALATICNP